MHKTDPWQILLAPSTNMIQDLCLEVADAAHNSYFHVSARPVVVAVVAVAVAVVVVVVDVVAAVVVVVVVAVAVADMHSRHVPTTTSSRFFQHMLDPFEFWAWLMHFFWGPNSSTANYVLQLFPQSSSFVTHSKKFCLESSISCLSCCQFCRCYSH